MFTQLAFLVYFVKLNQFKIYMRENGPEIKTTEVQQRESLCSLLGVEIVLKVGSKDFICSRPLYWSEIKKWNKEIEL